MECGFYGVGHVQEKSPFWHFIGHFDAHVFQLNNENDANNETNNK